MIKNFYRTPVAYVVTYGAYVNGIWTETSDYVWTTCNVQPWKKGLELDIEQDTNKFAGYKRFYLKSIPDITLPDGSEKDSEYIYYNGEFYLIKGNEDWSVAGKSPKHFKFMGVFANPQPDIEDPVQE